MRIEQLKYFTEIARTGSIRAASENLFISSPALGSAIQSLEKELGFPLFERSRSGVRLTEYGREALSLAQQILDNVQKFHYIESRYLNDSSGNFEAEGKCTISMVFAASSYFMYDIIPMFSKVHPKVSFSIIENSVEYVCQDVFSARSDLGIIFYDDSIDSRIFADTDREKYRIEFLYNESMFALVSEECPLKNKKSISLRDLAQYPLALTASAQDDNSTYENIFSAFPDINIVLQCNNINLINQHILKAGSVGLAFSSTLDKIPEGIKAIPLGKDCSYNIYAIYAKHSAKVDLIRVFLQTIKEFRAL